MKCKPCRVTFEGFRYEIKADGSVFGVVGALRNEPTPRTAEFTDPVVDNWTALEVRKEAARQRRNRNSRDRHAAMLSLGMVRNRDGSYE